MRKFCEYLREHAMNIINFKMKNIKLLTIEQQESYENIQICYICQEKYEYKYLKDKKDHKVRDIFIIQENIEVLHIAYVI